MYAWSVLAAPMAEVLQVKSVSMAFSMANMVAFISIILGGILSAKFSPRKVICVGGILFGMGMFLCGFAHSVKELVIFYGVILGFGMSFVYGNTIGNTIKLFPDRRGMIGGLTTASYGISSVIISPIANYLNNRVGVRNSFFILGIVFMIIIISGSFFIVEYPDDFLKHFPSSSIDAAINREKDKTPLEMVQMPIFYKLLLILTCGGTFGMMVISSARTLAVDITGVSAGTASILVSVLCLFNTVGRILAGTLSDYLGRMKTIRAVMLIAVLGLMSLLISSYNGSAVYYVIGIILVGLCFGTFMGVFPGLCTDRFGEKYNIINYGIMWIGISAAGLIGPKILDTVYIMRGRYSESFIFAIVLAFVGLGWAFCIKDQ